MQPYHAEISTISPSFSRYSFPTLCPSNLEEHHTIANLNLSNIS
ncbi:Uncharacterised protein [uncultured archaeon]|nr:Uncharacterised protein [uncultured archaeon]